MPSSQSLMGRSAYFISQHSWTALTECLKILLRSLSTSPSWKQREGDKGPDQLVTHSGTYFMLKEQGKNRKRNFSQKLQHFSSSVSNY